MTSSLPVLVIGGGIGGLCAAVALVQSGQSVKVFERAPELAEVGAGITLWSNAMAVLARLGVHERLRALGHEPHGGIIGSYRGKVLSRLDYDDLLAGSGMPPLLGVHRADLQRVLFEALPGGVVTLGATCTGFTQDDDAVTATFADGAFVPGRLLIGADGIHSVIRDALWGKEEARYAGYTCWRGVTVQPPGWTGPSGEIWGPGQRFGVVPIGDQRLYWFATANAPCGSKDDPDTRKDRLRQRFHGWAFHIPEIIEATPASAIIHGDILDRPPRSQWTRGRVTMLGDAAHATTPNLGQGAAMAIEDGIVLARALAAREDDAAALRLYEAARRARTSKVTTTSWSLGRVTQWQNGVARWLRDHMLRMTPRAAQVRQIASIAIHDAGQVPLPDR